ncbi:MAG: HDOD domain-containing protein [Desulfovermiculus sp.]
MKLEDQIYQSIREAPVMSPSAIRLVHLIAEEEYDLDEVVSFVRLDSGLTSNILRLVNSPAFGVMKPVNSIDRAVIYLGTQTVVSLALVNLNAHFFEQELQGYHSPQGEFWHHELRTALTSREIARMTDYGVSPDLAFTAGLLHDIGKIVISNYQLKKQCDLMPKVQEEETVSYLELEQTYLGTDHCQVGAMLAKQWRLPGALESSIEFHHEPSKAPGEYRPLVYMVHIGDALAMMAGLGTGIDTLQYNLDAGYMSYYSFTFDEIAVLMMNVEDEFEQLKNALTPL